MFTILGGDGKEYGPVPADQIRRWIAAGRANLETKAKSAGSDEWRRLGDHAEFGAPSEAPPVMAPAPAPGNAFAAPPASVLVPGAASPAGVGARIGAAFINAFFYFLSLMPGSIIFGLRLLKENPELARGGVPRIEDMNIELILQAAFLIYSGLGVAILVQAALITWRGQNLGKLMVGARVVRLDGRPAGFVHGVLLRYLVPVFMFLVMLQLFFPLAVVFLIVDLCFMFRDDQRCLHDLIAGTKVEKA